MRVCCNPQAGLGLVEESSVLVGSAEPPVDAHLALLYMIMRFHLTEISLHLVPADGDPIVGSYLDTKNHSRSCYLNTKIMLQ